MLPTKTLGATNSPRPLVALAMQTDQRLGLFPPWLATLAVGDSHGSIAVVVAFDVPLEAERLRRSGLDDELIGGEYVESSPSPHRRSRRHEAPRT